MWLLETFLYYTEHEGGSAPTYLTLARAGRCGVQAKDGIFVSIFRPDSFWLVLKQTINIPLMHLRYPCNRLWKPPHFIDNRLTDSGETVSFTHRPRFAPKELSGTYFVLQAESTAGLYYGWNDYTN
jgi:hypothetical protein